MEDLEHATRDYLVRVQPRSRADGLAGVRDGVLVVRVMAPPLDGRAK